MRAKLKGRQRAALFRVLDAHCTAGDNNTAVYENGWNDERVLAEARPLNPLSDRPYTLTMVSGERLRSFGRVRKLKPKIPAASLVDDKIAALSDRLDAMAAEHATLRKDHDELTDYYNKLVAWAQQLSERRGYTPPPGRPQSRPPMGDGRLV